MHDLKFEIKIKCVKISLVRENRWFTHGRIESRTDCVGRDGQVQGKRSKSDVKVKGGGHGCQERFDEGDKTRCESAQG